MFVKTGASSLLLDAERQKFLGEQWPRIQATIQRLGLKPEDLLNGRKPRSPAGSEDSKSTKAHPPGEES